MRQVDVLIIGGGPAGAALASLAAATGAGVLVVERCRFPRDKVCGEFVSPEGCRVLERLGVLERLLDQGARWMDRWRATDLRGRSIEAELPRLPQLGQQALGVSRALLDSTLLELARRRGAEVREHWEATAPLIDGGRVAGAMVRQVGRGAPGLEVRASVVVAADGRRSMLLRALHPGKGDPTRSYPGSWFGLKVHLAGDASPLAGRVELHQFDEGYAGLAAVEGGRINLCTMVTVRALRACGGSPDRLLRERVLANPAAGEVLKGFQACSSWKSVGPLRFGVRRPAAAGAMFVGDAAGTIEPYCGEGISNALRGAELALPYALQAAARGRLDDALAGGYRRAWIRTFTRVTRRVRWLGPVLKHSRLGGPTISMLSYFGRPLVLRLVSATRTGSP